MNILHITDFHIRNPDPLKDDDKFEALRFNYYEEYLKDALFLVKENIDYIVVTGDLVDIGKFDNYTQVGNIISFISSELNVSHERIFLTNGNHDVCRTSGDRSKFLELRNSYDSSKTIIASGDRHILYKLEDGVGLLSIDSIGNNFNDGLPRSLEILVADKIVRDVKDGKFSSLIVLSHHPALSYSVQNQAPFDESNSDWSSQHIWHDGGYLFDRLASSTNVKNEVYWFSGDIHRPEYTIIDGNKHLIVGSSLNSIDGKASGIPPSIFILNSEENYRNELVQIKRINFGHNNKGLVGHWERASLAANHFGKKDIKTSNVAKVTLQPKTTANSQSKSISISHTLVDRTLESFLYRSVSERGLYHFGKVETSHDFTSLGWVYTSSMLNLSGVYLKVINTLKKKVEELITGKISKRDCIIIGLDHWGAILASRLGAATNIKSCCLAVNDENRAYDSFEVSNEELVGIVKKKKMVFVVSDVISTGYSVSKVASSSLFNEGSNWYALCIIFDPLQNRGQMLSKYSHTYYLCGKISMPLVKNELLPDNNILKPSNTIIR